MTTVKSPLTTKFEQRQHLQAYLRLQLTTDTQVLLPMKQMQEVLVVPKERITPIPNMPDCVVGLLNQRNRVFWIIDLSRLLELNYLNLDIQEYYIAIVRVGNVSLGLVVQQVQGVFRISLDAIQSPLSTVPFGITPYLRGCVIHPQEGILLVLEPSAILNSPVFNG
ncbi:chemotaxis protein CheW [Gloeothece verrucosa]|uniref:CheW protein n=1 Tax=Gloeothece verrucosa (strain PCC 7822) TaxID=497965 RepID=E0UFN3_GLOV7|nr:chemotaxis protein CheW [Gloeothece verrucosa]ADN13144.1 CheW protein [Gloeothece verrucosa PCC 7822]